MKPRLFGFELAWADAAFDAIYPAPPRSALPHGIATMHPGRFFDDIVARVPLEQSLGLRVALWIIGLAPIFALRRLATIATVDADDRPRVIERLLMSPFYAVRQLVAAFKAMGSLLYAQSADVHARMTATSKSAALVPLRAKRSDPPAPPVHGGTPHEHAAE